MPKSDDSPALSSTTPGADAVDNLPWSLRTAAAIHDAVSTNSARLDAPVLPAFGRSTLGMEDAPAVWAEHIDLVPARTATVGLVPDPDLDGVAVTYPIAGPADEYVCRSRRSHHKVGAEE
jgi:hypothetical protein